MLLESIARLPDTALWVAQWTSVRWGAAGGRAGRPRVRRLLGTRSAVVRRACLRRVPRTVFHPAPHVDPVLVVLRRRAPAPPEGRPQPGARRIRPPAQGAGGSLALAPGGTPELRDAARAALEAIGLPADSRAERLGPEQWTSLAAELGPELAGTIEPRG